MASAEALAIQREQFEREQHERLERIEAKQDEILSSLRKALAKATPADKATAGDKSADDTKAGK